MQYQKHCYLNILEIWIFHLGHLVDKTRLIYLLIKILWPFSPNFSQIKWIKSFKWFVVLGRKLITVAQMKSVFIVMFFHPCTFCSFSVIYLGEQQVEVHFVTAASHLSRVSEPWLESACLSWLIPGRLLSGLHSTTVHTKSLLLLPPDALFFFQFNL